MKLIVLILIAPLLVGSACQQKVEPTLPGLPTNPSSEDGKDRVKEAIDVDQRLLVSCSRELSMLKDGDTFEDVQKARSEDLKKYQACASNNDSLIDLIKRAFNIK